MVYASPELTEHDVQDDFKTITHALEAKDDGPSSLPVQRQGPTPEPPRSISKHFYHAELCKMVRQMAQEEAERIYTRKLRARIPKVAEAALLDALQIGFASTNDVSKTAPLYFVEQIIVEMAQKRALGESFESSVECQTQPSTFINAFARRALVSFSSVYPVAKSIRKNLEVKTDVINDEKSPQEFPFYFAETTSLLSQSLNNKPYCICEKT